MTAGVDACETRGTRDARPEAGHRSRCPVRRRLGAQRPERGLVRRPLPAGVRGPLVGGALGRAGVIECVKQDGTRIELGRKHADDVCPGGDGVGFKNAFAARDAAGNVAVEAQWRGGPRDRVMLFDVSVSRIAEVECSLPHATFEGFHSQEVCWRLPSTDAARRFALWDPTTGAERTAVASKLRSSGPKSGCVHGARGPSAARAGAGASGGPHGERAPDGGWRGELQAAHAIGVSTRVVHRRGAPRWQRARGRARLRRWPTEMNAAPVPRSLRWR